jgi:hypothetical protein
MEKRISRRELLKAAAVGAAIAGKVVPGRAWATGSQAGSAEPKRSSTIKYINPQVPKVKLPVYEGTRYEAQVPDTLDLAERAALAVNGLTGPTDPEADYEIYWLAALGNNPPYMFHDWNDHVQIKFQEALPLMRLASGSHLNEEVDQRWMEVTQQMQGPDGLLYYPLVGRPWARVGVAAEQFGPLPEGEHYTEPYANGRLLGAIALYYKLTGDERWKTVGQRVVDGLTRHALHQDDYAYFSTGQFGVNQLSDPKVTKENIKPDMNMTFGWITIGLVQFYRVTGYEPALTLSGELARQTRYYGKMFDPGGKFVGLGGHFHGHTHPLLGMLEYGMVAGDWEMIQFARKGYEFAIARMWPTVGYISEFINPQGYQTSETCGVADMVHMAVKLTLAGAGDYWDDVDRWTRNQFAENQLTDTEWAYRMVRELSPNLEFYSLHHIRPEYATLEKVVERSVGGFAGWPSANDWQGCDQMHPGSCMGKNLSIPHCCTGNGTRAIYYVWNNILDYDQGRLRVNLLLNRASLWADVDSHLPYVGRVEIKAKRGCELAVRIPEWVRAQETRCQVQGKERTVSWDGRYALVGRVQPGDVSTLTFPIRERKDRLRIFENDYVFTWKGNDVVHIDPPGRYRPLYQRQKYRQSETQWKKAERFVAQALVDW